MKNFSLLILSSILSVASCQKSPLNSQNNTSQDSQILAHGNFDDSDPVPQSVALVWNGKVFCSGVILDKRTILTNAHCLGHFPDREIGIYFGPLYQDQQGPLRAAILVAATEIHPQYVSHPLFGKNDLAKLYFDSDLPLPKSMKLPILDPSLGQHSIRMCSIVYASGYGRDTRSRIQV
jgi:hypothetical protein